MELDSQSILHNVVFSEYADIPNNTSKDTVYAVPINFAYSHAPNYATKMWLSTGTTYTVGSGALAGHNCGYLLAGCTSRSDDSAPQVWLNGHPSYLMGYDGDYGSDLSGYCIFVPLNRGDSFSVNWSAGNPRVYFVPVKG